MEKMNAQRDLDRKLASILGEAEAFHSHLGPFLVIGVRAGLIGLERLKAKRGDPGLVATVLLRYSIPFSCAVDGVQFTTGCTIGNKRLKLEDSPDIVLRLKKNDDEVEIAVDRAAYDRLKKDLLAKDLENEEIRKLAYSVASIDESLLFNVKLLRA